MKTILAAAGALALALSLSGCMTAAVAKMSPQERIDTIHALGEAGCSGSVSIAIHGSSAAGASPGSANGDFTFNGACDPAKGRPSAPASPAAQPVT